MLYLFRIIYRFQKMALAVGPEECEIMEKRYKIFKEVFKTVQLINKQQVRFGIQERENCTASFFLD